MSQNPPQYYGGIKLTRQKPIPKQRKPLLLSQQAGWMRTSGEAQSRRLQFLRSPHQHSIDQHSPTAPLPRLDPQIQQNLEVCESYEGGSHLDQYVESSLHAQAETEVDDERGHQLMPYDPDLTCPLCNKQFRFGETQKHMAHVKKNCV